MMACADRARIRFVPEVELPAKIGDPTASGPGCLNCIKVKPCIDPQFAIGKIPDCSKVRDAIVFGFGTFRKEFRNCLDCFRTQVTLIWQVCLVNQIQRNRP